jgi:hypothetical protein
VAGVGEERQAAGPDRADDFGDHDGAGDDEDQGDPPPVGDCGKIWAAVVVVVPSTHQ